MITAPFLFGGRTRHARIRLAQIEAGLDVPDLVRAIEEIVPWDTLHASLVDALTRRSLPAAAGRDVASALLACRRWTGPEQLRIAAWLRENGSEMWEAFLSDHNVAFPPARAESFGLGIELLARARASCHGGLAPASFVDQATATAQPAGTVGAASAKERYAASLKAFHAEVSPQAARAVLHGARELGLVNVIAALFDSGHLDEVAAADEVISAFHELDWEQRGSVKTAFAARSPALSSLPPDLGRARLRALQLWARGRLGEAVEAFEAIVGEPETALPVLLREYLTAFAASGMRPSRVSRKALTVFEVAEPRAGKWVQILLRSSRRGGFDAAQASGLAASLELPLPTDPLFVLLAAHLQRMLAPNPLADQAWSELQLRLDDVEPRWRSRLPYIDREYARVVASLRAAGQDPILVGSSIRALLLLPPRADWIERVLALLATGNRGALLVDDEGCPTPVGATVINLCIRMVEHLLDAGIAIPDRDQQAMASGDPVVIASVMGKLLADVSFVGPEPAHSKGG